MPQTYPNESRLPRAWPQAVGVDNTPGPVGVTAARGRDAWAEGRSVTARDRAAPVEMASRMDNCAVWLASPFWLSPCCS
jgi:hypothetical protein